MFEYHLNKERYFDYQYKTAKEYLLPFVQEHCDLSKTIRVLEIGCGEAGVLKAFYELGHDCTGIELSKSRIKDAEQFFKAVPPAGKINFIIQNIYDIDPESDLEDKFDLIIMKDVIEHIPNQGKFLKHLAKFLKTSGSVFFGFPPWQMPYGGHQQVTNTSSTKLPYIHLLPFPIYKWLLRNQKKDRKDELLELVETGLSIEKFERLLQETDFETLSKKHFLFNPIYKYKFGLKPRKQLSLISSIPYLRNFVTSCVYYHVRLSK